MINRYFVFRPRRASRPAARGAKGRARGHLAAKQPTRTPIVGRRKCKVLIGAGAEERRRRRARPTNGRAASKCDLWPIETGDENRYLRRFARSLVCRGRSCCFAPHFREETFGGRNWRLTLTNAFYAGQFHACLQIERPTERWNKQCARSACLRRIGNAKIIGI